MLAGLQIWLWQMKLEVSRQHALTEGWALNLVVETVAAQSSPQSPVAW